MSTHEQKQGVYVDLEELISYRTSARGYSLLPKQPVHSLLSGSHASKLRGRGLNFDESRQYQPGDDIRHIDWKVTARTGKAYSRIYTEERERPTLLLVDQRLNMFFGSKRMMKSVAAAQFAAIAAWKIVSAKDRLGAIVFNDTSCHVLKPSSSTQQAIRVLQTVCEWNQQLSHRNELTSSAEQLNATLEQALRLATHDYLVCLVTDGFGSNQRTNELVTLIGQHNDVMIVIISDPMEHTLPAGGHLVFAQSQTQLDVNTNDRKLQLAYPEQREHRLKQAHEFLLTRKAAVLDISTERPVFDQVIDQIGQASARRRA